MIVTLAGHVDHGKTSLVRALTGVDTDRLTEEKRRGLTIDLGFAYLNTPAGKLGFVDVPGHHRFIHNMVAGVAQLQTALLAVAADDGPMPQSREHLQILSLLGVTRGCIALTKSDRVSAERLQSATAEIRNLVAGTFLEQAPIITTSTETGAGIDNLRTELENAAAVAAPAQDERAEFRLAIDRAFTIAGSGVVVTGTVHTGSVHTDDTLYLFPEGSEVRVRGVRAQDEDVAAAGAGDRCALNLAGVNIEDVRRGQWLSSKPSTGSTEFSVALQVLDDFPREVRHWLPVHVYQASAHSTGRIALLNEQRLKPGTTATVELVTDTPLLVARGDRLILRDQGLDRTLGGGAIVSARTFSGRRRASDRLRRIEADRATDPATAFAEHLQLGDVQLDQFATNWQLSTESLAALVAEHQCVEIDGYAVARSQWQSWQDAIAEEISARHRADESLQGIKQSELATAVPERFVKPVLDALTGARKLLQQTGRYLPAEHQVSLSSEEQQLLATLKRHLDQRQPPSLGDLAKTLRQPIPQLTKRLLPLVAKKQLVRVSEHRYYLPEQIAILAELATSLGAQGPFTVRQYRDAAEVGRNSAIEVLEYFDSRGFTRRDGDTRQVTGRPIA